MHRNLAFSLTALILAASAPCLAQAGSSSDASTVQAVQETQAVLADPKAIADLSKTNPDAAKADATVQSLTGGNAADSAAVYKLASEIFAGMVKESGGDAAGMEKIMADAMKNPQAFAAKLTPEQRAQLQALTTRIESRAPTSSPH